MILIFKLLVERRLEIQIRNNLSIRMYQYLLFVHSQNLNSQSDVFQPGTRQTKTAGQKLSGLSLCISTKPTNRKLAPCNLDS